MKVKIAGFLPNEQVTISWDVNGGQEIDWLYTDQNGATTSIFAPPSAPAGSHTLTALGYNSGIQLTTNLNIGPGIGAVNGDPGSNVTIYGGGFAVNDTLNVYFQTPKNGVVTATTDATGAFTASLNIPSTYNPTTHYYVYAASTTTTDHARSTFTFNTPTFATCNSYSCGELAYNQDVNFIANHFALGETVNIIWNYQQPNQYVIASGQYTTSGFNQSIKVPSTPGQSQVSIAAIGQTSHIVVTTVVQNDAAIYDTPTTGKAGTKVTINGGSFGSNDPLTLSLLGTNVATTTSNADGTFSTSFQMPSITGAGNLTLIATDTTSSVSASVPFQFTPVLKVNPTIVHNGDTISISGKHFTANASIFISWPNTPYNFNPPQANANGSFTITLSVSGLASGTYYVSANDGLSTLTVTAAVIVQ